MNVPRLEVVSSVVPPELLDVRVKSEGVHTCSFAEISRQLLANLRLGLSYGSTLISFPPLLQLEGLSSAP
jgi:hypothetical protein